MPRPPIVYTTITQCTVSTRLDFLSEDSGGMCVLFLHYCAGVESECRCPYALIVANNRDENFQRPTSPAHFWPDHPEVLAGRDENHGGTWMGVSTSGRFAVLTNYRTSYDMIDPNARSRGRLVSEFLCDNESPSQYCEKISTDGNTYNGFAMLAADLRCGGSLVYYSNKESGGYQSIKPGVHGLSNHLLNSPWRKVERGRERLTEIVAGLQYHPISRQSLTEQLISLLSDDTSLHPDPQIPDTGFVEELKKKSSAIFVQPFGLGEQAYGTRTSSVVLVGKDGHVTFTERTRTVPKDCSSEQWKTSTFNFDANLSDSAKL